MRRWIRRLRSDDFVDPPAVQAVRHTGQRLLQTGITVWSVVYGDVLPLLKEAGFWVFVAPILIVYQVLTAEVFEIGDYGVPLWLAVLGSLSLVGIATVGMIVMMAGGGGRD